VNIADKHYILLKQMQVDFFKLCSSLWKRFGFFAEVLLWEKEESQHYILTTVTALSMRATFASITYTVYACVS